MGGGWGREGRGERHPEGESDDVEWKLHTRVGGGWGGVGCVSMLGGTEVEESVGAVRLSGNWFGLGGVDSLGVPAVFLFPSCSSSHGDLTCHTCFADARSTGQTSCGGTRTT